MSTSDIAILPADVASRIAAGEVVDRPASALKELLENALDAGAHRIDVRFSEGGIRLLSVSDDGDGMTEAALRLAVERYATSKIRRAEDLQALVTYGFRGEALAAMAAAATRLTLASRPGPDAEGACLEVTDGSIGAPWPVAMAPGTRITIEDLFGRLPARKAFLKSARGEAAALHETVLKMALAAPRIALRLTGDHGEIFASYGTGDRADVMVQAYGDSLRNRLLPVSHEQHGVRVEGYLSDPSLARPTRGGSTITVQGRVVESRSLAHAVESAYQGRLPRGRFPVYALAIQLDPADVDVNVHPQKREVRFSDEGRVYSSVHRACLLAFEGHSVGFVVPGPGAEPARPGTSPEQVRTSTQPDAWPFGPSETEGTSDAPIAPVAPGGPLDNGPTPVDPWPPPEDTGPGHWLTGRLARPVERPLRQQGLGELENAASAGERAAERGQNPQGEAVPEAVPEAEAKEELAPTLARGISGPDRSFATAFAAAGRRLTALRQVRLLYIVAENPDGLELVDQHAASERIRYEALREAQRAGRAQVRQRLLTPLVLTVDPGLEEVCETHHRELLDWGFEADPFGPGTVRVHSVPPGLIGAGKALQELLQTFASGEDGRHDRAALVACHTAVRAGDPLSLADMQRILDDLALCEAPATCPHGRPTVRGWSWAEVARLFARRA